MIEKKFSYYVKIQTDSHHEFGLLDISDREYVPDTNGFLAF